MPSKPKTKSQQLNASSDNSRSSFTAGSTKLTTPIPAASSATTIPFASAPATSNLTGQQQTAQTLQQKQMIQVFVPTAVPAQMLNSAGVAAAATGQGRQQIILFQQPRISTTSANGTNNSGNNAAISLQRATTAAEQPQLLLLSATPASNKGGTSAAGQQIQFIPLVQAIAAPPSASSTVPSSSGTGGINLGQMVHQQQFIQVATNSSGGHQPIQLQTLDGKIITATAASGVGTTAAFFAAPLATSTPIHNHQMQQLQQQTQKQPQTPVVTAIKRESTAQKRQSKSTQQKNTIKIESSEEQQKRNKHLPAKSMQQQTQPVTTVTPRSQQRITLGNLSFQQDPNDPQKWIITNDSGGSTSTNSNSGKRSSSDGHGLATAKQPQHSTPVNSQAGNVVGANLMEAATTSRQQSVASQDSEKKTGDINNIGGAVKRIACNCPNCVNNIPRSSLEKGRQHICYICAKTYGKTSHLRAHLRGHEGNKPFACDWPSCTRRFTRSDELQRHKRTHTGEKRFLCERCGKKFMRSDHLNKHMRTHIGNGGNSQKSASSAPLKMEIVGNIVLQAADQCIS